MSGKEVTGHGPLNPLLVQNGGVVALADIPVLRFTIFSHWFTQEIRSGKRVLAFFVMPPTTSSAKVRMALSDTQGYFRLVTLIADEERQLIEIVSTYIEKSYPCFTGKLPQMHLYERLLYELFGITPEGHPWLKPVRFSKAEAGDVGVMNFFRVDGDEVHEVAVGPIHAGVIGAGHFRFQCLGEHVMHLEISLGYHHRGVIPLLFDAPDVRTLPIIEAAAGDSSIAYAWAYSTIVESLTGTRATKRAQVLRALALELERLANHTGDLGAGAGDVGFLSTMSFCGRLRGDWLNTTALLCGSRFGRNFVCPGGTWEDVDAALIKTIRARLQTIGRDVKGAIDLIWESPSVMSRLTGIGQLRKEDALALGCVGMAARACGIAYDSRATFPLPDVPAFTEVKTIPWGDIYARFMLRQQEIHASLDYCHKLLDVLEAMEQAASDQPDDEEQALYNDVPVEAPESDNDGGERSPEIREIPQASPHDPDLCALRKLYGGDDAVPCREPLAGNLQPEALAVSLVEGWRGEVCHVGVTNAEGRFAGYYIMDPSFHNWMALAVAMRNQQISDFPLCNVSFNLSYGGHDL